MDNELLTEFYNRYGHNIVPLSRSSNNIDRLNTSINFSNINRPIIKFYYKPSFVPTATTLVDIFALNLGIRTYYKGMTNLNVLV